MKDMTAKRTAKRGPAKKRRALVRGEPVVRGILAATLEELGRVGYQGLRIEDVATRAGVNKTTIYRRWPTNEDLVRAALLSITADKIVFPSTGSIRDDLIALGRAIIDVQTSPEGKCLFNVLLAEGLDSDLMKIARSLRGTLDKGALAIIEGAVARGELSPSADPLLPCEMLGAFLQQKKCDREPVDDALLARVVDVILGGVLRSNKRKTAARR
jgi:AcrR family transcriptional regulator